MKKKLFLIFIMAFTMLSAQSDEQKEAIVKAFLLEKFTRFIDFSVESNKNYFVIGVIGRNPFVPGLSEILKTTKIKNKEIKIEYYLQPEDISNCDLLYISRSENRRINRILSVAKSQKILTVGEGELLIEKGVIISLLIGRTIKFEINNSEASDIGISISYKLLNYADRVL